MNGPLLPDCACDCTNCCGGDWSFQDIVYKTQSAKFTHMAPETLDLQVVDNRGTAIAPTVGYVVNKNVTESELFVNLKRQTLEIGREFKCPLPHISNGRAYESKSTSSVHYWAKETSRTELKSVKYVTPTVPYKKVTLRTSLEMTRVDVPFTMTMKYKFRGCQCTIDGKLKMQRLKEIKFNAKEED